jgi:hypothetical protein
MKKISIFLIIFEILTVSAIWASNLMPPADVYVLGAVHGFIQRRSHKNRQWLKIGEGKQIRGNSEIQSGLHTRAIFLLHMKTMMELGSSTKLVVHFQKVKNLYKFWDNLKSGSLWINFKKFQHSPEIYKITSTGMVFTILSKFANFQLKHEKNKNELIMNNGVVQVATRGGEKILSGKYLYAFENGYLVLKRRWGHEEKVQLENWEKFQKKTVKNFKWILRRWRSSLKHH